VGCITFAFGLVLVFTFAFVTVAFADVLLRYVHRVYVRRLRYVCRCVCCGYHLRLFFFAALPILFNGCGYCAPGRTVAYALRLPDLAVTVDFVVSRCSLNCVVLPVSSFTIYSVRYVCTVRFFVTLLLIC